MYNHMSYKNIAKFKQPPKRVDFDYSTIRVNTSCAIVGHVLRLFNYEIHNLEKYTMCRISCNRKRDRNQSYTVKALDTYLCSQMALFRSLIDKCKLSTSLHNSKAQTKTARFPSWYT
jgi:hypothetical protein